VKSRSNPLLVQTQQRLIYPHSLMLICSR